MQLLSQSGNYRIYSSFGDAVVEGSSSIGANGSVVSFEIDQIIPEYNSFFWKLEPVTGAHGDFWEEFFSNRIGGEPADEFANSGFTSGSFSLKLNPDLIAELDENFQISFYLSPTDPAFGVGPVASASFSVLNDDLTKFIGDYKDNVLIGTRSADRLFGNTGNDSLSGGAGADYLDGGAGVDAALYSGLKRQHMVSGNMAGWEVASSSEGIDKLSSVEIFHFLDGRLVFDVTDPAASTFRMYQAAFDRAPDAAGLNYWVDRLQAGGGPDDIGAAFVGSAEFQGSYGTLAEKGYVEQLYRNVLGREGEAGGIDFWSGHLEQGRMSRGQVLADFAEGAENVGLTRPSVEAGIWDADEMAASVARLYAAALDRLPDVGGLTYWINTVKGGLALSDAADSFVFSNEFQGKYGSLTNSDYIDQLYLNVLDRPADAEGLAHWTEVLEVGALDRGDVLFDFSDSLENQTATQSWLTDGLMFA